jgi:arginase
LEEERIMKQNGLIAFTMNDVTSIGIQSTMKSILSRLPENAPIHLSLDVDGLDPKYAPSTGTPVKSGLHLEDALYITRILGETGRLVAIDLVEVNPDVTLSDSPNEDRATTIESACAIIKNAVHHASLYKTRDVARDSPDAVVSDLRNEDCDATIFQLHALS